MGPKSPRPSVDILRSLTRRSYLTGLSVCHHIFLLIEAGPASCASSLPGECPEAKPHRPKVHRGIFEYHSAVSFSSRPWLGVLVSSVRRSCRRVPVLARRCTGLPLRLCLARSLLCCS